MRSLKTFFDFYVYSNIHVALAAFSLTKISLLSYGIFENESSFFVFFATIISYNFIISYKINEIDIFSMSWIKDHKKLLIILNIISVLFLIIYAFNIKFLAYWVLIPFAITTFFYIVPYRINNKNLRSIASLKLFLIALTWAGITVLFPLIQNEVVLDKHVWVIFFQRFLFILAITIPFDIRDKNNDHIQLKTLPQVFGVKKSKIIGSIALILFFILEFYNSQFENSSIYKMAFLSLSALLFIIFSKENKNRFYTAFWVEALPIFWLILLILF